MRVFKLFILFLVLSAPCMAKIKVVEKSAKKVPVWVNTIQENYIITSAIKDDLEEAKRQCMDNIKTSIIDAVAQNVKSSSEGNINQETVNSEIVNFLDKFNYSYQAQSANVPYLTGISSSKIEDFYWEKREDKETGKITYLYAVKYPFPRVELKKLVHEFEKKDQEMYGKYKDLEAQYADIVSVEQIDKAITDLDLLVRYFFDDIRKNAASNLQRNYRQLYNQINFREISNKLGNYEFALVLNGLDIATSQRPVLKSERLTQLRAEAKDKQWNIYYDYSTCDPSEENAASVTFRLGGKSVAQKFYIDVNQGKVNIYPAKDVYLTATTKSDTNLTDVKVRMNLESKTPGTFTVKNITFNVPGLGTPLFLDDADIAIKMGTQTINILCPGEFELLERQDYKLNLLKGYMEIEDGDGNIKRVDFSLPFRANW